MTYYPPQNPSQHFTWQEAEVTSHRSFDNRIPIDLWPVIINTAQNLEAVKSSLDFKPILVSSWYRCPGLNTSVGSSSKSQHLKGEAVDFIAPKFGTAREICERLAKYKENLRFDQLIYEHTWVHISFLSNPNAVPRMQVLTLLHNKKYAQGITDKFGAL
jgi:zinc D-Ala-D-Ala carboxypeptidase